MNILPTSDLPRLYVFGDRVASTPVEITCEFAWARGDLDVGTTSPLIFLFFYFLFFIFYLFIYLFF